MLEGYPDRIYDVRNQAHPGQAFLIQDENGRYFLLRVPELGDVGDVGAFCFTAPDPGGHGAFLTSFGGGADAGDPGFAFLADVGTTALQVYQTIADAVNGIRGMGVRWTMIADPLL